MICEQLAAKISCIYRESSHPSPGIMNKKVFYNQGFGAGFESINSTWIIGIQKKSMLSLDKELVRLQINCAPPPFPRA